MNVDAFSHFLSSWTGQFAAGAAAGGVVWKFTKTVGDVLSEHSTLQVAVWLLDAQGRSHKRWHQVFGGILQAFQRESPSFPQWLILMVIGSLSVAAISNLIVVSPEPATLNVVSALAILVLGVSSRTRSAFRGRSMAAHWFVASVTKTRLLLATLLLIASDLLCGYLFAALVLTMWINPPTPLPWFTDPFGAIAFLGPYLRRVPFLALPYLLLPLSLLLYWTAGMAIRAAKLLNIGFEWFNATFDIEKKPLQSLGVVAGALVAIAYWVAAIAWMIVL